MIGLSHNLVRHVDRDVLQYWTDTKVGSSGAPVFNSRWEVVGLHITATWTRRMATASPTGTRGAGSNESWKASSGTGWRRRRSWISMVSLTDPRDPRAQLIIGMLKDSVYGESRVGTSCRPRA